ncbi:hypothetical protein ACWCPF_05685 [Streptomyces sp. NPDC001858]
MNKPCSSLAALDASNGELQAAVRTAQKMLAAYGDSSGFDEFGYAQAHGALSESLRILLRALDAEPTSDFLRSQEVTESNKVRVTNIKEGAAPRCPAAHPEDPTPCGGPVVVTVLDRGNAGAHGCEHHAARLLASLDGGRVYALGTSPEAAAIRVFKAAAGTRPYPWVERGDR